MYTVLNSGFQVKGSLTLNNGMGSTAFFADTITQQIATDDSNNPNTLLSNSFNDYDKQGNTKQWNHTLTLSVEATNLGTSITTSDYIMYFDEVAKKYYMMKVIDTATDRNSGFIKVDCINTAIYELGKQLVVEEKTFKNATLSQVVESVYKNAPFSVVIQDDLTISIDYTISANTSLQSVVQDLQTKYNVDVDSWITLDNDGQIGERVLYFGHLGSDNGELIRYGGGKGFENINAQELSDIIYTKVYITGVASDTDTKKGHIGSVNNGLEYIVDDDANQRIYTVGASQQQPVYLEGQLTNNILSEPSALLDWGKEQLALFNHPRFNYTVTPLHDEVVGIGDSITVQDFHIQPMILVTSKVIQKSTSFASPETNTFVLGEFSSIFSDRASKNNMVIEVIKKDVTVVQAAADIAKAQADEAHRQAILAQEQAIHAQTSADGKTTTYTVDSVQDLPDNAIEGDIGWVKLSDGTHMYSYTDGKWVEKINPSMGADINKKVSDAVTQAKTYTTTAIEQNNASQQEVMSDVAKSQADLAIKDGDFNNKAQAMADKALADAKTNTAQAAQDALNSANQNLADAKKSLTDGISKEASDRASAVNALDTKAQGYADTAKKNAIDVATSADGVINKKIDDTASSITSTVSQNKKDAEGKITTAQSTATQALNGLSSKVDTAIYNAKTGQLSTDVTNVTQTANQAKTDIASIKQTDTTQDARMTTIEADASGVKTTVSDLKTAQGKQSGYISTLQQRADGFDATVTKVNGLSVGSRNLIIGSKQLNWTTGFNTATTSTKVSYDATTNMWHITSPKGGSGNAGIYFSQSVVTKGQSWSLSFDIKGTGVYSDKHIGVEASAPFNSPTGNVPSDWTRISSNGVANGSNPVIIYFNSFNTALDVYIKLPKFEKGNIPTDWSPAPEDVDSATAKAQLTADNAALAVTKLTNADGVITKAQADIKANADAITQKVSKTVYDQNTGDLTTAISKAQSTADGVVTTVGNYKTSNDGRVKAAESKIDQNSNDITARVTKTDYNQATGKLSGDISTLQQRADGFDATVTKVDNLAVGGRNLLLGTEQFTGDLSPRWEWVNTWDADPYNGHKTVQTGSAWGGPKYVINDLFNRKVVEPNTDYTLSVKIKNTSNDPIDIYFYAPAIGILDRHIIKLPPNSGWTTISTTFQFSDIDPNIGHGTMRFEPSSAIQWGQGTIIQTEMKFERGNITTDWTPAPEDIESALAQVKITADGVSSIVSNPTTGLSVRVQTAEGTLNTVKSTADGAMSKASQTANDIKQEISDRKTGDSNTLQSSKDFTQSTITNYDKGVQSTISQTASGILAKVGATNLFPNSEFDTDYGYKFLSGNVKLSLDYKWAVGSNQNGVVEIKTTTSSYQGYVADKIAVFGGSTISFSTLLHYENGGFASGQAGVDMRFYDKDGNETGKQLKYLPQQGDYWTTLLMENIYVPDTSVSLSISLIINDAGVGQYAVFAQPMLVNSSTIKKYAPNTDITTTLMLLKDNWSIGITDNIGNITSGIVGNASQMSLISKNIILDGNTTVTGDFYAKGGNFDNINASHIKVGTLDGYQVNIANINVNNLVGDTITGFNINANKQITIASGGSLQSDVVNMSKNSFSVSAPNIGVQRTSSQGYNVTVYGTFNISSLTGTMSTNGTVYVTKQNETKPYKQGDSYSSYSVNNIYIYTKNYNNGDPNEHLNISSAEIDIMTGGTSGLLSDSTNATQISSRYVITTGSVTAGSAVNTGTVYSGNGNLWLNSANASTVLQGGGTSIMEARKNGYMYYLTKKTGSGGASVQASTSDGAFFIQTSATKYKEDIQYDGGTSVGDRFLTLDPATWQDKGEYEQRKLYRENGTSPDRTINMDDKRYYGLIAEDLVKSGLEEFVVRDEVTGEVNGLEYDKVAISLIPVVREQRNALNELRVEIERLKDKING